MIKIPEQTVKAVVDYILKFLREDYREKADKKDSYLYLLFGQYENNSSYDYWKNSVALLTRNSDHPRTIETHFFLNRNRFSLPTIHVTINSDANGADGLGFDQSYIEEGTSGGRETAQREINTRFQIVVTSDNTFEVLIMYHALKCCLIGNNHLLTLNGLQNPSIKGGDIILNDSLNPQGVYARAIFLDCFYTIKAPSFESIQWASSASFEGTPTLNLLK